MLLANTEKELTYTVKKEALVDTVQASGKYKTASQIEVFSPTKGILSELYVDNNSEVNKGDPLFHIESVATDQEKAAANADYQTAFNNIKVAQQNKVSADATMWTEHKALLDAKEAQKEKNENTDDYEELEEQSIDAAVVQAEKDFTAAEKKYVETDSSIVAAQAKLNAAKLALAATQSITINAPATGTIVNLQKRIGDEVAISTATQQVISAEATDASRPVLVIADLNNPGLTVSISEVYIPRIQVGQKVRIVFDALKDDIFDGVVESVDNVGTETGGIVTYNARVAFGSSGYNLKPNMTSLVTIETLRKEDVLTVPNSAIIERDNKHYVKKANADGNGLIEVTTGVKGLTKTEIISGVEEGIIILANANSEE